ncbi:MAG: hypothetical protein A2Y24_03085 [Clostridiales bacterium GWE2_32_10]|nr:MAG: hypothetical protein A2Y24_03085 [Clostridiales bacterium GWE2_32_10]HBY21702.1 hypothetical protein [Clostridiales bacterium]
MEASIITVDETENMYGTIKFLIEDLTGQVNRSKKVYKYMYDNCKDYDKTIFQRMYNNSVKHYKMMIEIYKEMHFKEYNETFETTIIYNKYDAEKCMMDTYDMLDDYTKIYTNLDDTAHYKKMIFEIIQDLQKNISMLGLVYMGEE